MNSFNASAERSGAQVLIDQLRVHGVDTIFCVPGESYLDVLDALYDTQDHIRLISARQEGGAAFMAEAYGKLTNKPGVCFVTRGPGASNAVIGVHTAFHDSTPLVLFIGQVARGFTEREAFQEIDFRRLFGPISKWVTQIDDPRRIPELVARAFQLAQNGRPGPVVIALPEDMQAERVRVADAGPARRVPMTPAPRQMQTLRELLAASARPVMIVGGPGWTARAAQDIAEFASANQLPAVASFRAQDIVDNTRSNYAGALGVGGDPALGEAIARADLVIAVGDRLSELATNDYTLLSVPRPAQQLAHVFPDPDELGRVYQTDLAIVASMPEFAAAARAMAPLSEPRWAAWTAELRTRHLAHARPPESHARVDLPAIMAQLRAALPANSILTNGAGQYTALCHRYLSFSEHRTQVAPVNGTMGYGVPAAVAARAARPDHIVVAFAGDGCFLMNGQELATAVQYDLPIIVIVINNSQYGSIRMHQEKHFPARPIGTALRNPDFAAYARAFGASGAVVIETAEFAPAFARALAQVQTARQSALIEIRVA